MGPKTKEYSTDFRNAVVTMSKEKFSLGQIADILKCSKSSVQYILEKFSRDGSVNTSPGRGRPRLTTSKEDRIIQRIVKKNRRISAEKVRIEIKEQNGMLISPSTVRNRLSEIGLHGRMARKKPLISKKNQKTRVTWIRELLNLSIDWNKVLWSDECKFNVFGSDGRVTVWRKPGEEMKLECIRPTVKHGNGSVMVWGCFSSFGVGNLVFIDGIMYKEDYLKILKENLLESAQKLGLETDFKFQHDRDPKHTAKIITHWLNESGINVMKWIGQSPDMNPIENLWALLKRKLKERQITGKNMLKRCLLEEWQKITPDFCNKMVNSMNTRCNMVIKNKGGPINY